MGAIIISDNTLNTVQNKTILPVHSKFSFRFKYGIIGAVIVSAFGRLALAGTGHSTDYHRYLIPLFVGSLAGFLIGQMKDKWVDKTTELEQEIHDRKVIELELVKSKESLMVTLQSIGDGVITTDLDGRIILINKVTEKMTGWRQDEVSGLKICDIFNINNPERNEPCENPIQKIISNGNTISLSNETILVSKNGTKYFIEGTGAPICDKNNKINGAVLAFSDVTEMKKTNNELTQIEKLKAVGILAGGIAHDFNNLLTTILGNIEIAQSHAFASTHHDKCNEVSLVLKNAKKATIRAKGLTQQLLTFAKGGDLVKKTSSVTEIITDSADFVIHGKEVNCTFDICDDIFSINVDPGQISQVIQNIIINANNAMADGGTITIKATNISDIKNETVDLLEDKYVKIEISDTGSGIVEDHLYKIFDPYFSTSKTGSGLGLSICHSIIKKHGGNISVKSITNEGTTFTIYLPVYNKIVSIADCENKPSSHIIKTKEKDTKMNSEDKVLNMNEKSNPNTDNLNCSVKEPNHKPLIMLMDDDEMIRNMVKQMFNIMNYETVLTEDGEEAIAAYKEHLENNNPIDVIIMDLTIPGKMGGKQTIGKILEINPDAKVIVASGYSNDPIVAHYEDYGFKASIVKPFEMEALNNTINSLL